MSDIPECSILVVDDEVSNLYVLNQILKDDHIIYAVRSGKVALKKANENKPDLILLDILMPDMNGFEVLAELKKTEATRDIPVIFITGLSNVEDEQKGFRLGAVDYITKPFNSAIVKARVETHIKIIKQIRTIERFGMIDALTEIPNRRSFDSQIDVEWCRAVRERTPISMLMLDIDKFKDYNDTYGHPQGDLLLKAIAKLFVSALKQMTDLVFRWGGEEFAVLLPGTNLYEALDIAEKIRADVESITVLCSDGKTPTPVTVSVGAAEAIPFLCSSPSNLISEADQALYTAKETGRNRVCPQKNELTNMKEYEGKKRIMGNNGEYIDLPVNDEDFGDNYFYEHFSEFCDREAVIIYNSKWWLGESDLEIVKTQLYVKNLTMICDTKVFLSALSNILERPVRERELAEPDLLITEFEMKYKN